MSIEGLQEFLFWCMLINFGVYVFSVIAVLVFRGAMCNMHSKMFGLDEAAVKKAIYAYLANYKLLIIVFNLVPWLATLIIK